jgi:hypothetical protein
LEPMEDIQKRVYIQIKNTSDKNEFNIEGRIKELLQQRGYNIVRNLKDAHYLLQANILQVGKCDPSAAERDFAGGYGRMLQTAGAGAMVGGLARNMGVGGIVAGGLIGGVVGTIADAAVKDVTYTVITDL